MSDKSDKLRVLVSSDSSLSNTGFGIYNNKLTSALHNSPDFEVAELASFGMETDVGKTPWKFYPTIPKDFSKNPTFGSNPQNKYGRLVFEGVLLDFLPDIIISLTDPYMCSYQAYSSYRRFFKWFLTPTVDSMPQKDEYLSLFSLVDTLVPYSNWGHTQLTNYGFNNVNPAIRMGVDTDIFKPCNNKQEQKQKFGLEPDAIVIGSVMRNQIRKLLPELLEVFSNVLKANPDKNLYLYLHTTYPDLKIWEIPHFLNEFGIAQHVLFTYKCNKTGRIWCSTFQDGRNYSFLSNSIDAIIPGVKNGVTTQELAEIYNLFDLYIQYANCEGFGIPIFEAAACGVPVAAVDYSAMTDISDTLGGDLIPVDRLFFDMNNNARRALPDNAYTAEYITKFIQEYAGQIRLDLVDKIKQNYSWDTAIQLWIELLKSQIPIRRWNEKAHLIDIPQVPPRGMNNSDFVLWAIENLSVPEDKGRFGLAPLRYGKTLSYGYTKQGESFAQVNQDNIFQHYKNLATAYNKHEEQRCLKFAS